MDNEAKEILKSINNQIKLQEKHLESLIEIECNTKNTEVEIQLLRDKMKS